jgi:hypothetical protein
MKRVGPGAAPALLWVVNLVNACSSCWNLGEDKKLNYRLVTTVCRHNRRVCGVGIAESRGEDTRIKQNFQLMFAVICPTLSFLLVVTCLL